MIARPQDDPKLHQGRTRTTAHVDGVWPAHIFIDLQPSAYLRKTLRQSIASCSNDTSSIYSLLDPVLGTDGVTTKKPSLHLSLSRPLLIAVGERRNLKSSIANLARKFTEFETSFAELIVLENDEKTRRFLALEIGYGYNDIKPLVDSINVELQRQRLPVYYDEARFHASIAWCTLPPPLDDGGTPVVTACTAFDEARLKILEQQYGKGIRDEVLFAGEICLSIGKEVFRYPLQG